jgi:hypothetical protein
MHIYSCVHMFVHVRITKMYIYVYSYRFLQTLRVIRALHYCSGILYIYLKSYEYVYIDMYIYVYTYLHIFLYTPFLPGFLEGLDAQLVGDVYIHISKFTHVYILIYL